MNDELVELNTELFSAFGCTTRLKIICLLLEKEQEKWSVEKLVRELNMREQPTISHHLKILKYKGLVDCVEEGLYRYYKVRRDVVRQMSAFALLLTSLGKEEEQGKTPLPVLMARIEQHAL